MNEFQEQILEHYKNPKNYGVPIWNPTHSATVQNLSCGDEIQLHLKIEEGSIKDISFTGEGCSISIASASMMTEELKNQTLKQANQFNVENLISILGITLTPSRMRCANLSIEALHSALAK